MSSLTEQSSENDIPVAEAQPSASDSATEAQVSKFLDDLRSGRLKQLLDGPRLPEISSHPEYAEAFRAGFYLLLESGHFSDAGFSMDFFGKSVDMEEDLRAIFFDLLDHVDPELDNPLDRIRGFKTCFARTDLESAPGYAERVTSVFERLLMAKKVNHALQFREMAGMNVPFSNVTATVCERLKEESEACIIEDQGRPRNDRKGPMHFLHIPLYRGMIFVFKIIEVVKAGDLASAAALNRTYNAIPIGAEVFASHMFKKGSNYHPHMIEGYAEALKRLAEYKEVPHEIKQPN